MSLFLQVVHQRSAGDHTYARHAERSFQDMQLLHTLACSITRQYVLFAGDWANMSDFRRLLILRALKPERIPAALYNMCEKAMGSQYVNQDAFRADVIMEVSVLCAIHACSSPTRWLTLKHEPHAGVHISNTSLLHPFPWLFTIKGHRGICPAG